jgi:phage terminase small subunit
MQDLELLDDVDTPLSDREKLFVSEYVKNFNASEAARAVGVSEASARSRGCNMLAKASVQAAVQALVQQRLNRNLLTADRVVQEIARLAFSDVGNLYDEQGLLKSPRDLDPDTRAALASVESVEDRLIAGVSTKKVKMYDKVAALTLAAKHLGMLVDRVAVGGDPGLPPLSIEEGARRIAFAFSRTLASRGDDLA